MALPKFTIYKHIKPEYGWRYCKAAFHSNGKIKPDIVVVNGVEKAHREGAYYLNHNQMWIPVGGDAKEAEKARRKRLNSAEYDRLNGITAPDARPKKTPTGITLQIAIDAYLEGMERAVASRNKRKGTLDLARTTLRKISEHSKVQYLSEITVAHLDNYAAWCIATGGTHSSQTGRNENLRVNQFLRAQGVLTKIDGKKQIPIGMKDAPKVSEAKNVVTNTPEELEKFFAACRGSRVPSPKAVLLPKSLRTSGKHHRARVYCPFRQDVTVCASRQNHQANSAYLQLGFLRLWSSRGGERVPKGWVCPIHSKGRCESGWHSSGPLPRCWPLVSKATNESSTNGHRKS